MRKPNHRIVAGLISAFPCPKPNTIPISRPRGVRAVGLRFERAFVKALKLKWPSQVLAGQWFQYQDINGKGHCQTDVMLVFAEEVIIFECKLTETDWGRLQLTQLYFPVVARALNRKVRGVVVTRHLTKETNIASITDDIGIAIASAGFNIPTLHWREANPL